MQWDHRAMSWDSTAPRETPRKCYRTGIWPVDGYFSVRHVEFGLVKKMTQIQEASEIMTT